MNRRCLWRIGLLMLASWAGGCAHVGEDAFNATLLPPSSTAAAHRTPGRVGLLVQPAAQDQVHDARSGPAFGVRIHVGRIVEGAMFAAMNDALLGGAQRMKQPQVTETGLAGTLSIDAVRVEHDSRLAFILPLPVFPFLAAGADVFARLSFDLSLLDTHGQTVWKRSYDTGLEIYKRPTAPHNERQSAGMVRMAHEQAWRLSQQVIADLRDWLATERNKPREI